MSWINEFAKGSFSLYSGNTISAFQPLDFFHFYGIWYDLWLKNVAVVMDALDVEHKSYTELRHLLPTPSNMRALLQKAIPAYIGSDRSNKELYFRYTTFISRMLMEACPEDPFGITSTPLHTIEERKSIIKETQWQQASPVEARLVGKLVTSAGSLVHGLYNDVVTDFGWDAYGPYDREDMDSQEYTLLIRNFPDMSPADLWSEEFLSTYKHIQIFQLYKDVQWEIGCVGCHTIVKSGSPITGLKYFSVVADGKPLTISQVEELILELGTKAEHIYKEIRKKNFEELKQMVMLQECYQLQMLFEAAHVDWRPSLEMIQAIEGKELLKHVLPHDVMMTELEQYKKEFRLIEFEQEVILPYAK